MMELQSLLENYATPKDCLIDKNALVAMNITMKMSRIDIATALDVHISTVVSAYKRLGMVMIRHPKGISAKLHATSKIDLSVNNLVELHHIQQLNMDDIAGLAGVHRQTMVKIFNHLNIRIVRHSSVIMNKREDSMMKRFGVTNAAQSEQLMDKRMETNVNRYRSPNVGGTVIPSNIQEKLDSYDWLLYQHHTLKKSMIQISKELSVCDNTVAKYIDIHGISKRCHRTSFGENEITEFLLECGVKVISNDKTIIPPLELDMYLPEYDIAIEYCGLYWHADKHSRIDKHYHANKYSRCRKKGIKLLTIFEDEWKQNSSIVKSMLSHMIHQTPTTFYGRNCSIVPIDKNDKNTFLENNHLQGKVNTSTNIALECNGKVVSLMCFKKTSKSNEYELSRFVSLINTNVVGGFSKLLKYFVSNNNVANIKTFSDNRWGWGELYIANNFVQGKPLSPDYYYSPDGYHRFHKFLYRRHLLPNKLAHFDPNLSEWENCKANNVLRIWDCGKQTFNYATITENNNDY